MVLICWNGRWMGSQQFQPTFASQPRHCDNVIVGRAKNIGIENDHVTLDIVFFQLLSQP